MYVALLRFFFVFSCSEVPPTHLRRREEEDGEVEQARVHVVLGTEGVQMAGAVGHGNRLWQQQQRLLADTEVHDGFKSSNLQILRGANDIMCMEWVRCACL